MQRFVRMALSCAFLVGCTAGSGMGPSSVPAVNKAIGQALGHQATSWDIAAKVDDPTTGEYAVIYRYAGGYGFLEARQGGQWHAQPLGQTPTRLILIAQPTVHQHLGFIGGTVAEESGITRVQFTLPWEILDVPVHDHLLLASVELQRDANGIPSLPWPIPFKAFNAAGHVLLEGNVPYYDGIH